MNTTAAMVVALVRNVDAPELPKRVWLDPPPKAAPISAPLPVWSRTIMIRAIHTMTCTMINSTDTVLLFLVFNVDETVKSQKLVIPAKAGVQNLFKTLDERRASLRVPPSRG